MPLRLRTMTIQVTQAAISEILRLKQQQLISVSSGNDVDSPEPLANKGAPVLAQLDFVQGGCLEQRYQLCFDTVLPNSHKLSYGPVELSISPAAWPHVQKLTLDYVEDLMGGSFRFDNPELDSTCNCGQSFRLASASV